MATSPELMHAILALDSYNRDYNPGIDLEGTSVGTANILSRELLINGTEYGEWQAAGFYASAYLWNGETIISYRGTDNIFTPTWIDDLAGGTDFWNGYGTVAGLPITKQAKLAAEFYQAVTGTQTGDPLTGSATLVGHSLGVGDWRVLWGRSIVTM